MARDYFWTATRAVEVSGNIPAVAALVQPWPGQLRIFLVGFRGKGRRGWEVVRRSGLVLELLAG